MAPLTISGSGNCSQPTRCDTAAILFWKRTSTTDMRSGMEWMMRTQNVSSSLWLCNLQQEVSVVDLFEFEDEFRVSTYMSVVANQ